MGNYAVLSAAGHRIDAGSAASIDDLPAADCTFEGWFRFDDLNGTEILFHKLFIVNGLIINAFGKDIQVQFSHATTTHSVTYDTSETLAELRWHHIAVTWDASEFTSELFVDGVSFGSQQEGAGAYSSDASGTLYIGNLSGNRVNSVSWVRISDNIRYNADFTPANRNTPPSSDVNTVRLFKVNEGSGTTIADSSSNGVDATLSGGWANFGDVDTNTNFLGALQRMTVTGVTRHYDEPPASLKTADLPAAFPLMPGAELPGFVVSCLSRNVTRGIQYAIAIEAAGQGTQAQNYRLLTYLMDNLETSLKGLLESEGGTLSDFMNFSITTGTLQEVAGNQYWSIIADITASAVPL